MADETLQHPDEPDVDDAAENPSEVADELQESAPEADDPGASEAQEESVEGDAQEDAAPVKSTQRRREARDFEVSGDVTIDGKAFPLRDWSSSGFGIISCDLEFEDHARVPIDFNVTHSTGSLSFSCKAIIVRADTVSCEVAGAFVEMGREDRVAVTAYFDSLDEA